MIAQVVAVILPKLQKMMATAAADIKHLVEEDYTIGDITKAVAEKTKQDITRIGKEVTGKEDYQIDDVTKAVADKTKQGITKFGQEITGKEEYQIGDVTKAVAERPSRKSQELV